MSVADILNKIGDWTLSTEFVRIVSKELGVQERTAYRKIENAVKQGTIKKIPLPGRGIKYGLPNWPVKDDDLKLLIDALNAMSLSTLANAAFIEAMAKFIEATRR